MVVCSPILKNDGEVSVNKVQKYPVPLYLAILYFCFMTKPVCVLLSPYCFFVKGSYYKKYSISSTLAKELPPDNVAGVRVML